MTMLWKMRFALIVSVFSTGIGVAAEPSASFPLSMENRLEEGILLQEGAGDPGAAAHVFKEVATAAGVAEEIGAEAQFRLAECYAAQGNKNLADAAFEALLDRFPNAEQWTAAARKRLPKAFVPEMAPWSDGERIRYQWKLPSGKLMGYSVSTVRWIERDGRGLWRQAQRLMLNGHIELAVEVDPETFKSVRGSMVSSSMEEVQSHYADDGRSVDVAFGNGAEQSYVFDESVVDNEQALLLMRQLPIEIGYVTTQSVFVGYSGISVPVRFEIVELLDLETAAGTFPCYKVELTMAGPKQYVYLTADERRMILRFEVGGIAGEIYAFDTLQEEETEVYRNAEYGFTIEHSDLWTVVEDPQSRGVTAAQQYFLDPGAQGGFLLYSDANAKLDESERSGPEALARSNERKMLESSEDRIVEGTARNWDVNGLPAHSYKISGSMADGKGKAIYVTVVMGESRHFVFQGHMPEENYDEMKPQLDALVAGLRE